MALIMILKKQKDQNPLENHEDRTIFGPRQQNTSDTVLEEEKQTNFL